MEAKKMAEKRKKETEVVELMITLYCSGNHGSRKGELCPECKALADYAADRVAHCPHLETKTFCSNCRTHCYRRDMRERICTVMRWSGPRMMFHHPVMAVHHLIESEKERRRLC